jgi:hypothetical protein
LQWQATNANDDFMNYLRIDGVNQLLNFDPDSHPSAPSVLRDNLRRLVRDSRIEDLNRAFPVLA